MASPIVIVGVLGNIISSLVYLSPMKTFWRIVKKRSTEDFSCIPYVCTLLNGTLWVYYGIIKPNSFLVATVNGFGAVTQIVYILIFLTFASPRLRAKTAIQFGILDVGFGAAIILFTKFMFQGDVRIDVAGFICVGSTMIAYGSPLAVMKTVIATKSVEYMPFLLSFAILLNGGVWTFYAVLAKDYFLGVPNGIGFLLGIAQLVLYAIYHRHKPLKKVSDNLEDGLQNESLIPASDPVS
ncbi:unnamed protein product [Dovyalis caffra]|uniref:Bidirectional sugar transporter SWEET n=1 Tax=Dovyalis caffra TaxID=77055 RepID=A0AAV1RXW2_9ROSI|nr:unnamed protein product [Dovyalis caffra]